MDSFISTMETNALMGMNVAQLIVDDYLNILEHEEKLVEVLETALVVVSEQKEDL
jgi:prenylcysteine oxidase/farnesylcysteine lyase